MSTAWGTEKKLAVVLAWGNVTINSNSQSNSWQELIGTSLGSTDRHRTSGTSGIWRGLTKNPGKEIFFIVLNCTRIITHRNMLNELKSTIFFLLRKWNQVLFIPLREKGNEASKHARKQSSHSCDPRSSAFWISDKRILQTWNWSQWIVLLSKRETQLVLPDLCSKGLVISLHVDS